jgi:hypothetical protein
MLKAVTLASKTKRHDNPKQTHYTLTVSWWTWEDISADLIGPLPESKGHNAILTIIDWFSNMIHLIPTTTEITALRLAELYRDNIWKMHGLPHHITSD